MQATILVHNRIGALKSALRPIATAMEEFVVDWSASMPSPLPSGYDETQRLAASTLSKAVQKTIGLNDVETLLSGLSDTVSSYDPEIEAIDALIVAEGGGSRIVKLTSARSMCDYVFSDWEKYLQTAKSASQSALQEEQLAAAHIHVVESRKRAVQQILDEVATIANNYYEKMHPMEGVADTSLSIRPTEAGSVMLNANFHGQTKSPLLHYRESHLDTLGLAYFLAFRRREATLAPDFRGLVLDDVLHSVDAEHRGRISLLLRNEFSDHQLIITTHDRYFYDRLRFTLGSGGYKYLSLLRWDIVNGPLLGDASTDLDRILDKETRQTRAAEDLASAGGRLMELLLRNLTEKLQVAIVARFERPYDIGALWPPLAKKLRRRASFVAINGPLADNLEANAWVRNRLGAHYDEAASSVTPSEVEEFAEHLAQLYRATYCEICRTFIAEQSNDDWRCTCGSVVYPKTTQ